MEVNPMATHFRFTLRTLMLLVLAGMLIVGWWADHWRMSRLCHRLKLDAELIVLKRELRKAIDDAHRASDTSSFEQANRRGLAALGPLRLIELEGGGFPGVAVGECGDAVAIPNKFSQNCEFLLSQEATAYLVRNGKYSIPIFVGLIHDERIEVRQVALRGLLSLAGISPIYDQTPLSQEDAHRLAAQLKTAAEHESDSLIAQQLQGICVVLLAPQGEDVNSEQEDKH